MIWAADDLVFLGCNARIQRLSTANLDLGLSYFVGKLGLLIRVLIQIGFGFSGVQRRAIKIEALYEVGADLCCENLRKCFNGCGRIG